MRKILLTISCVSLFLLFVFLVNRQDFLPYTQEVEEQKQEETVSILFFGDIMFDRDIRRIGSEKGYSYLFSCIKDILIKADAVVANLEGPITANKSVSLGSKIDTPANFQFTFDPVITDALLLNNIGYVNIGNNHILNFGWEGLDETRAYLSKAGIKYFGNPKIDNATTSSIAHIKLPGRIISLINYNQFPSTSAVSPPLGGLTAEISSESSKGNFVVIYAHWGEEYVPATPSQIVAAHAFIDAGADIVIGSHPHVVQERELYKGKYIFYSLGNFIFDQWFDDAVTHGLGVRLTWLPAYRSGRPGLQVQVEELSLELTRDGRTCPVLDQ